jgi:outer membrane protein OmpA-like peptidoglycan-associated protein
MLILRDPTGKITEATTNADGKYVFDPLEDTSRNLTLTIKSELYRNKTATVKIENIDESDLLTDVFINTEVCVEIKSAIKAEDVVVVYFDFDKSILKPEGRKKLDSIYSVMKEFPTAKIQIFGYTDGMGTVQYNKVLSHKRAVACVHYLVRKGIKSVRLSFESFGKCCPVEMEIINGRDNPNGRSKNRRALLNVKKE